MVLIPLSLVIFSMYTILNNLLQRFLGHQWSSSFTGVIDDPRYWEEKITDYRHEERDIAAVADPFSNVQITESPFSYENQNSTSSCVPHGVGLALAIERKKDTNNYSRLSYMFNYRLRDNYAAEGSYLQGQFNSYRHVGAPLFTTLPDTSTEEQANAVSLTPSMYAEASIFKGLNYFTVSDFRNIDTLASIAAQGHGIAILIFAAQDEWGRDFPIIEDPSMVLSNTNEIRHCVCILPNSGFMLNAKKYVTIQDSAWFGGKKLRYLSEDWIKSRVYGAAYWSSVSLLASGPRPVFVFGRTLQYGSVGSDVKAMQQLFISEGLLPSDCATGNFYGLTLSALHAFQTKYKDKILTPLGLDKPTDVFGEQCIKWANQLCGGQPS